MLEQIRDLIHSRNSCVLATVSENRPRCSLMAYISPGETNDFYMVTSRSTRKFHNIMRNPHVSLLIDTRDTATRDNRGKSLTVMGTCEIVPEGLRKEEIKKTMRAILPHIDRLVDHPDSELLRVRADSYLFLDGLTDSYFENAQ